MIYEFLIPLIVPLSKLTNLLQTAKPSPELISLIIIRNRKK